MMITEVENQIFLHVTGKFLHYSSAQSHKEQKSPPEEP